MPSRNPSRALVVGTRLSLAGERHRIRAQGCSAADGRGGRARIVILLASAAAKDGQGADREHRSPASDAPGAGFWAGGRDDDAVEAGRPR